MIDILVPVLNRPDRVKPLADSIAASTATAYRLHWLLSPKDWPELDQVVDTISDERRDGWLMFEWEPEHDYPRKMNSGYLSCGSNPFLLLAADDLDFQPGWDTTALAVAEATGAGVIGTNDKANGSVKRGQFSTHSLIRRSYIEEHGGTMTDGPGIIFHEGYDHNFVDRELCGVAMHRGQWAFAADSVIVHRHPNWHTAPMDSTYEKGLATFHRDQKLFFERAHTWEYAGLNPAERRMARRTVRA